MKKLLPFVLGGLVTHLHAELVTFTDRTTFEGSTTGLVTEDFEDISSIGEVLASTNIESGLTLSLTSGTDAYLAPPGQSSNPTTAIGVNTPSSAGWSMAFSPSTFAVGFDVFQNNGGGTQFGSPTVANVSVFGTSGLLESFSATILPNTGSFVGIVSTSDEITEVTVNDPVRWDVIDNVSFGQADISEIPEVSSFLTLAGIFGFGLLSRRR